MHTYTDLLASVFRRFHKLPNAFVVIPTAYDVHSANNNTHKHMKNYSSSAQHSGEEFTLVGISV